MTNEQKEAFLKNPRYVGMKFHEIQKPETLEKRFLGKMSKKALAFIKSLLKMDPEERLSANKALEHPYFDGIRDENFMSMLRDNEETVPSNLFNPQVQDRIVSAKPKDAKFVQQAPQNQKSTRLDKSSE
jgi:cyclin-dependent kinase-like